MKKLELSEMKKIIGGQGSSDTLPPGIEFLLDPIDSPFADGEPQAALENGAQTVVGVMIEQGRF